MPPILWRVLPVLIVATALLALWKVPAVPAAGVRYVRIAAGPATTPTFLAATALANVASRPPGLPACQADRACGVDGVVVLAQSQPTPEAVLAAVAGGQAETGVVPAAFLLDARCGPKRARGRDLALLANVYSEAVQVVVRAGLAAASPADLKGSRLVLGAVGSDGRRLTEQVLQAYGLKRRDVRAIELDGAAALAALQLGKADAVVLLRPFPDPAVAELVASGAVRLLPVSGPEAVKLSTLRPTLGEAVLPAGTYGAEAALPTLAAFMAWVASPALEAELALHLTAAAWRPANRALLSLPEMALAPREAATLRAPVPAHAGAAAFYGAPAAALSCPDISSPTGGQASTTPPGTSSAARPG